MPTCTGAHELSFLDFLTEEDYPAEAVALKARAVDDADTDALVSLGDHLVRLIAVRNADEDDKTHAQRILFLQSKARQCFQIASDREHADGQFKLGVMVHRDSTKAKDKSDSSANNKAAALLYRRAAEQGHAQAQYNLGLMYYTGDGVPERHEKARTLFQAAAEQNLPEGQCRFGIMLAKGEGGDANLPRALELFRAAADQGDANAQFNLGMALGSGLATNGKSDPEAAAEWLRQAADAGHTKAQCYLAGMHLHGNGVPKDTAAAQELFRKAANKGDAESQFQLAILYEQQKKPSDAALWFEKAAMQGDPTAMLNLAMKLLHGKGIKKDESRAVQWLQHAVEQGQIDAMRVLAMCYGKGMGVEQDVPKAVALMNKFKELHEKRLAFIRQRQEAARRAASDSQPSTSS
ncbi:MAG: hypothetical protein MHM6MM_002334 [Cercozoa sp. M6MM]